MAPRLDGGMKTAFNFVTVRIEDTESKQVSHYVQSVALGSSAV
jgi:hypothetical protein